MVKFNILVEGNDLTLVTYGAQVHECIEALKKLVATNSNISVELIDLRTIKPLDIETIINSVRKTGRLLVVHDFVKSFSVSAEIIARVNEKAFEYLKAPLSRLTGYDITVPLARGEKYHAIDSDKIITKIKKIVEFKF
ncbi:transketolase C-terminal domain-containing protein [Mycoplasmopsis cynos]|uniref:transketolase C-terminal domain-containing protein n=1 Tax=Mycoplasmopsis cynos TaxID=171284 RepID=UPI0025464077|nr:transketolase C-terminal domain-containing protein [Mycoplasmopsis cynos]